MNTKHPTNKLAQSASALGAGILGFGIGARWGNVVVGYAFVIIVAGAILHVWGMYVVQMKNNSNDTYGMAKLLWISAWICLIVLIGTIAYLFIVKKQ